MAYGPCDNNFEQCPYFIKPPVGPLEKTQSHGCYSDVDHVIPQRLGRLVTSTQAEREYIHSEENKKQTCRWIHDMKGKEEDDVFLLAELKRIVKKDD